MTVFPAIPLDVRAAISLTAGAWTDITGFVFEGQGQPQATVGRGKPDESSQAQPGTCTLKVANQDGRFTFSNPLGAWYGSIGRNTPVRVSVPAQGSYLRLETDALSYASCPDAAGLHVTGDLDVRADVRLTNWTGGIIAGKWVLGGSANSWLVNLNPDGTVTLFWSTTGADILSAQSAVPLIPQVTATQRFSVRVTLDVNNGASGRTVTWYTGAPGGADGSTWTQLGPAVVQSGTTSIFAGTGTGIAAGNYVPGGGVAGMLGSIWELEVRSGIGGTVVAHPVFSGQAEGATSFADAESNTWTVSGTAEISARSYRFHGELSSSAQAQDPTGTQRWVPLRCGGLLRRIQQVQAPVLSAMRRAVAAQGGTLAVHAYWPAEDLPGSTSIASGIGGAPMTMTGGTGDGTVSKTGASFAADSSFLCSLPIPQMATSAWLGQVPAYASHGSLIVRFLMDVSTGPANNARIMRIITTGRCREWVVYYGTGGALGVAGFDASGAGVFDSGLVGFAVNSTPVWVSMELRPGGGSTVNWSLVTLAPGASGAGATAGTFTGAIGNATQVQPGPAQLLGAVGIGHISVQSDWQSLFGLSQPLNAWQGETAGNRFARLCGENGITSRVTGPPAVSAAMGAQAAQPLTTLLQECEDADRGMIYEPRQAYALGYRTLASMLGQGAAVSMSWGDLDAEAWQPPADDDQRTVNDAIVTRSSGSTSGTQFRATLNDGSQMSISAPPAGAGDYQQTYSVNVETDGQVPDVAGWIAHVGTVPGARFPGLPLNLARSDAAALIWAAQEADLGDYLQVNSAPPWVSYDQVRQLAFGQSEQLGVKTLKIGWNGVPEVPFEVALADDAVYGHADTDGSTLAAGATSAAATLSVATTNAGSPLWTTAGADFPFDINIGGERITVTNITGSSSPQSFTVVRSVNGVVKAQSPGADVRLWSPAILAIG